MIDDARSFIQQYIALNRTNATARDLARLYAVSHTAGACADLRAKTIGSIPMVAKQNGEALPETHPLAQMLHPRNGIRELMERAEYAMFFWGRCLFYKERNAFRVTRSLRWINPLIYMLDVGYADGLRGFRITSGTHDAPDVAYIHPDDAVYMHSVDFEDDFDGISPLERAFLEASIEPESAETLLAIFRNRAIPATYVQPAPDASVSSKPNPSDKKDLVEQLRTFFQGAINAGRTLVTLARWEWKELQGPLKDMVVPDLREDVRLSVCVASDIPYELIVMKDATYENLDGARRAWGELWVEPTALWYAEQLTHMLAAEWGSDIVIEPDFSKVSFLQEKAEQRMAVIDRKVQLGVLDLYRAQIEAGIEPDDALRDLYMIGGVPVPREELATLWERQYPAPTPQMPFSNFGGMLPAATDMIPSVGEAITSDPAAQVTGADVVPVQPEGETRAEPSLWVGLEFEGNPDLLALQQRLRELYPNATDWTAPGDFHVTMAYAPSVSDAQADAVENALLVGMFPDEFTLDDYVLTLGSLRAFDTVGQFALHFRIRRSEALITLQSALVEALRQVGVSLSSYSVPERYIPHVTMGYLNERPRTVTFSNTVQIQPTAITVAHGDDVLLRITVDGEDAPEDDEEDALTPSADAELRTAQRYLSKHGAAKYLRRFVYDAAPDYLTAWIRAELDEIDADARDVRGLPEAVFADALLINDVRAYYGSGGTREQFKGEVLGLIQQAYNDETTRRAWASKMRALLRRFGLMAFIDGIQADGNEIESLSQDQLTIFRAWQAETSGYISNFGAELFKEGGIQEWEVEHRADLWCNKSLDDIYFAGLREGAPAKMGTWRFFPEADHCDDCAQRHNKRMSIEEWGKIGFPRDRRLSCGGWECKCQILDDDGNIIGAR